VSALARRGPVALLAAAGAALAALAVLALASGREAAPSSGPAPVPPSAAPAGELAPCAEPGRRYAHTLAAGESLALVSARAGVSLEQVAALSRLADPDRVLPGTALILRPPPAGGCGALAGLGPAEVRILVRKAEHRLELWIRGVPFRHYRAGLSRTSLDDKRVEGDGCTPEGDFYVCQRLADGRYGPSLGLSYPDAEDAERGRREGLIGAAQYRDIVQSVAARRRPPWDTPLGGAICIHGRGAAEDWTAGCVALDDADAGELFALTPPGAAVRIVGRERAGRVLTARR
jgi:hypothetical protein